MRKTIKIGYEVINKITEKKEFSQLPLSVIERVLKLKEVEKEFDDKEKVKKARAILRKAFTAFLTEKILKGKFKDEQILKSHYSTKNRDYNEIYLRILDSEDIIIDLGAGINGFSYKFMKNKKYIGIEAVGQLVDLMNNYFKKNKFNARAINEDLFNVENVIKYLKIEKGEKIVFMFNIIDALELFERNFSKKFLFLIAENCSKIVLSFPVASLGRKKRFKVKRYWLLNFIEENFKILDDFELNEERFIVFRKV